MTIKPSVRTQVREDRKKEMVALMANQIIENGGIILMFDPTMNSAITSFDRLKSEMTVQVMSKFIKEMTQREQEALADIFMYEY